MLIKRANGVRIMAFIAILTVGRLKLPDGHSATREFFTVGSELTRQAARSGHLIKEFSPNRVRLPEGVIKGEGLPILTLTVWDSLSNVFHFTYSGLHKQALRDRNKWIEPHPDKQPTYVLWWTEMVKDVSWKEAFSRYNYYLQNGPTPAAFDFKQAFDEAGETFLLK